MITTIDKAGRVVVPKNMRLALGLAPGTEVELRLDDDGHVLISAAPVPKRLEMRDGRPVIVPERPIPPLTDELVRETLESIRR